jgi:hypothetical protein
VTFIVDLVPIAPWKIANSNFGYKRHSPLVIPANPRGRGGRAGIQGLLDSRFRGKDA